MTRKTPSKAPSKATPKPPPEPEPSAPQRLVEHPGAAAAALTGLAALVVWLVNVAGYEMPPAVAATAAGIIVSLGLAIRRYGLSGLASIAWRGDK